MCSSSSYYYKWQLIAQQYAKNQKTEMRLPTRRKQTVARRIWSAAGRRLDCGWLADGWWGRGAVFCRGLKDANERRDVPDSPCFLKDLFIYKIKTFNKDKLIQLRKRVLITDDTKSS